MITTGVAADGHREVLDCAVGDSEDGAFWSSGEKRRQPFGDLLGSVGEDTEIRPPLYVDAGSHVTMGVRSFANFGLVALDVAPITVGDDVHIGPHVQLLTPTHPTEPEPRPASRKQRSRSASATTSGSVAESSRCRA